MFTVGKSPLPSNSNDSQMLVTIRLSYCMVLYGNLGYFMVVYGTFFYTLGTPLNCSIFIDFLLDSFWLKSDLILILHPVQVSSCEINCDENQKLYWVKLSCFIFVIYSILPKHRPQYPSELTELESEICSLTFVFSVQNQFELVIQFEAELKQNVAHII